MISALDSSVILDVLTDDPQFATLSERVIRRASTEGRLVLCESVLAEVLPAFTDRTQLSGFLSDWQIDFLPSSLESATLAGEHFARYLARGGQGGRVVVDFLIGAHAQVHADRLVARDRGYLRDYFSGLRVMDPVTAPRP
jgi:predicted nucleic acid-binding protein